MTDSDEVRRAKYLLKESGFVVFPKGLIKPLTVSQHVPYWSSLELAENDKYKGYLREAMGRAMASELLKSGALVVEEETLPGEEGVRFTARLKVLMPDG